MNFKDLDQNRLQFVIRNATKNVLSEFYKKNQKRLILEGVKIQIIPADFKKGVELFASLKPNAVAVARNWFEQNLDLNKNISLEEAIQTFIKVENKELDTTEDLETDNAKIIFIDLLQKDPDLSLLKYMQTEIRLPADERLSVQEIKDPEKLSLNLNRVIDFLDKKVNSLDDLSLDELLLLSILNNEKNDEIVLEAKKRAIENNIRFDEFDSIITRANSNKIEIERRKTKSNSINLIQSIQLNDDKIIDLDSVLVIGNITNIVESTGNRFIKVIGILDNKTLYELNSAQKQRIFPDSGDLIWYAKDFKRLLNKNEIGIFKVVRTNIVSVNNPTSAKFGVHEFVSKLNLVKVCDENRFERKALSNWFHKNEHEVAEKYSYVLAINKLIKPNKINNQKIDFDRPMEVIVTAEVYKIQGLILASEFSTTNSIIDLSAPESYLKKILRHDGLSESSLTKNQIIKLIDEIKLTKEEHDPEIISEILLDLNELLNKQDIFDCLISKISEKTEVKSAIEKIVEEKSTEILKNKNFLNNEVRLLEEQKNNLTKSIAIEKEQLKKIKTSFSNDIKDVFQKAIINGRGMLAESAFFHALVNNDNQNVNQKSNEIILSTNYSISHKRISDIPFVDKAKLFPYKTLKIQKLISTLLDCSLIGMSIGLKGGGAGILARIIAEGITNNSNNEYIDIEVRPGLSNLSELNIVELMNNTEMVYLIRNFDISPISIYGHDLVDICYLKVMDTKDNPYPKVIVTFEDSGLGLDFPIAFKKSMVVVDLDDFEYEDNSYDLDEYENKLEEINPKQLKYLVNKLISKIRKFEIDKDSGRLHSLLGLLDHCYLNNSIN